MKVCAKCLKEMYCLKTGVTVRYGIGHCYRGDKFACRGCGAQVVLCRDVPFHSEVDWPEDELIQMPEGE